MKKLLLFSSCLFLALSSITAQAAIQYWDPQGTTAGNPYTGSLSGTWEASSWSGSSAGAASPTTWVDSGVSGSAVAAVFAVNAGTGTPAFTVTLNANHTVAGFFVNGIVSGNFSTTTLQGPGVVTIGPTTVAQPYTTLFANLQGILASSGTFFTINNNIAGTLANAGAITLESSGSVALNGTNTYNCGTLLGYSGFGFTGALYITNADPTQGPICTSFGSNTIGISNCLGAAVVVEGLAPITVTNTVTVFNKGGQSVNLSSGGAPSLTFSGPFNLGTNTLIVGAAQTPSMTIISGVISGSGGLTKGQGVVSTGTLQLNATNTFTGALTISNTTLALGPNGAVSNAANIFISAGGTFDVSALSSPYILSSSTTLNASGTGTIVGSTAAAINGPASGAVNLGAQPINLTFDGSDPALYIPQGALTLNGNLITVNPTEPLSPGTYTLIQVAGGIINGAPSTNAVVLGAGVENGCLATIQSSGGTVSLVVASQGNLDQWNGADYGTSHDWGDGANWANGTPPNLFGDDVTFAGSTGPTPVMDNSYTVFSLTFANGSSPFTLTAASTNVLTVSDGVTNSSSSLQTLNLPVQLADYGQADQTIWDVTQGPIAVTGVLSDTGRGLAVTGGNTLALSNLNTYTGGTVISNGATVLANTISDANCSIGPSGSVVVGAGSTFTYTGTASTATSRTFTFTGGAGNLNVPSGVTLTLGSVKSASSGIGTLGGGGTVILGGNTDNSSLGMTVGSGSTLVLDKNPSASTAHALGGTTTTISSGALLQVAGPGSYQIYSTGILLENSGGAIDFDGQSDSFSTLTLAGTGINNGGALLNSATGTTSFLTNAGSGVVLAGNTTIGGPGNIYMNSKVTGAFALTYAGTGTLTLGAVGAYSGGTTVNAGGTLQLTAGGVISNSAGTGSITLNGNGILSLNMTNTEVNSVITGGSTSSINIKMGNGNLWLSNSVAGQLNNFSGTFNVNSNSPTGGQLVIGSPTATETINPGATWQIQSSVVVDFNVGQTDPATVYLYGAPYSGGNVGALRLDDSVQSGPVILMGNTQIGNGSSAGASTISGVISSPGGYGFAKMGADPIALSATNTYSGATTISAGALLLSGNGSISNSSKLSIAAGTTFDVSALNSTTFALSSSTSLSASGTGTTVGTTAASINGAAGGTVNLGAQPISLTFTPTAFTGDSTHPSLYIAQGALTLGGNTITVSNAAGTRLGAGVYTLIQVAGGSISGAPATAVAVTGTGLAAGTSATLSVSGGSVIMTVVAAPLTKPAITGVNVSGTTLTITATNGTASGNYVLLESTNVGLPTTNWIPVLTNTFDINGNINLSTNIVNPAVPREFYIIENP